MRAHAGVVHPPEDEIGGGAMLGGEEDAGEMLLRLGNRAELVDPADDLLAERKRLPHQAISKRMFCAPFHSTVLPSVGRSSSPEVRVMK